MFNLKVSQLEHQNQFLIEEKSAYWFQSYGSICAKVDKETDALTLGRDWNYSNTTRKHLYIFLDWCAYGVYRLISGSKNKRQAIQKLINDGVIKYDKEMF